MGTRTRKLAGFKGVIFLVCIKALVQSKCSAFHS